MSIVPACALFGQGADALLHIVQNPKGCHCRISCAFSLDRDSPEVQFLRKVGVPLIIIHWKTWHPYFVFRGMSESQRLQEFYTAIQRTIFSQFSAQIILCDGWTLPITDPLFSTYPRRIFSLRVPPSGSDHLEIIPLLRPQHGIIPTSRPRPPIILPAATDEWPPPTDTDSSEMSNGEHLGSIIKPAQVPEPSPIIL